MKKRMFECCYSISDGDHLPPPKSKHGIPFITISNITEQNKISFNDVMYVPEEYYNNISDIRKAKQGDILYSVVGSFGKPVYIEDSVKFVFQRHIAILRPNEAVVGKYLYYYMLNPQFYRMVDKLAIGCSQRTVTLDTLRNIEIELPEKDIQQKIVDTLSVLDKKIICNSRINDNLEAMLKLEYEYHFIQQMDPSCKKVTLNAVASLYQPKTISGNDLVPDGIYFVYGANGIIGKYNQFNHADYQIAIACRGASCGALTMTMPYSWITGNAMVVNPLPLFPYKEYLYYTLTKNSVSYLTSGSAQPQLTRENMSLYSLSIPSYTKLQAFETKAKKARAIIISNTYEIIEMQQLRDWLLPMLMNGQATIED